MKSQSVKLGYSLAAVLVLCALPGHSATSHVLGQAAVSGVVRDTQGVPQVGVVVELLRANVLGSGMASGIADSSIVSRVFTDRHGRFSLLQIEPGTYSLEAVATSFLPALRQNVRIRTNTVVNLTLSTLFEAAQWLPAEKRPGSQPDDDWIWTLRSSANRPLLRMLDSGPLVLVDGEASRGPATRARVTASGGTGTFGEGNLRNAFEVQHSTDDSRQLIVRAELSAGGTAGFESVAAYRHEMAPGHTMRTVLAVQDQPEVRGQAGVEGMQALLFRSSETLKLTDHLVADAGNEFQAIKLGRTNVASYPFAGITWSPGTEIPGTDLQDPHRQGTDNSRSNSAGSNSISYRMATSRTAQQSELIDSDESMVLPISIANGISQVEHGLHQEVSLARRTPHFEVEIAAFHDHIINPIVSGGGSVKAADAESGELLLDGSSGGSGGDESSGGESGGGPGSLIRVAGQSYSGSGVIAEAKEQIGAATWVTIECADGTALALGAVPASSNMIAVLNALQRQNVQVFSIALSGRINSTGTRWRTSYRWQPADTVTAVAPFESSPEAAYLSIYLRQPIHFSRVLPNGVDAVIDLRNLLAEGYRPFVTADGSTLYFAQTERAIEGGLSFSF